MSKIKYNGMKYIYFFFIFLITNLVCSFAQSNDYKLIIKKALLKYTNCITIDSGLKIVYESKILNRDSSNLLIEKNTLLYNSKKIKYENMDLVVLMDSSHSIYINRLEKAIYIHQNNNSYSEGNSLKQMIILLDKSLDNTELIDYISLVKIVKIKIKINQNTKKSNSISQITYLIDIEENKIKSILLDYDNNQSQIKTQELKFLEQSIVINDPFFEKSIEMNVFNNSGTLLNEFFGFQIVKY